MSGVFRIGNEIWQELYFFVGANNVTASSLICYKSVADLKEYILRRHYAVVQAGVGGGLAKSFRGTFSSKMQVFKRVLNLPVSRLDC